MFPDWAGKVSEQKRKFPQSDQVRYMDSLNVNQISRLLDNCGRLRIALATGGESSLWRKSTKNSRENSLLLLDETIEELLERQYEILLGDKK